MIFPSKKDWWLVLILVVTVLVQLVAGTALLLTGQAFWVGIMLLLAAAFTLWLMQSTYYVVGDTELVVRCGPFRCTVQLSEIEEIMPSRSLLSSPALSLDRLRISFRHGGKSKAIMISPADKAGFLCAIIEKEPGLRIEETTIIRR